MTTTILIVDDRAVNRQFMATLLGYFDYRILEAVNGVEALFIIRTERPDLVITDILMPRMDGLELVAQLRNDESLAATKVIFYSATYRLDDARSMAAKLGVNHVISKPAEPRVILDAVAVALGEAPRDDVVPTRTDAGRTSAPAAFTEQFFQGVDDLEATSLRLAAIVELCLDMTAERDPNRLITLFCGAARDILGAHYAAVAITDGRNGPLLRFVSRGYDEATEMALRHAAGRRELLPNPPSGQHKLRGPRAGCAAMAFGVTPTHGADILAVSLNIGDRDLGWVYVADRQDGAAFDDEDVHIAHTLGAMAAQIYENAHLFEEVSRHAGSLRRQIGPRRWTPSVFREPEVSGG